MRRIIVKRKCRGKYVRAIIQYAPLKEKKNNIFNTTNIVHEMNIETEESKQKKNQQQKCFQ